MNIFKKEKPVQERNCDSLVILQIMEKEDEKKFQIYLAPVSVIDPKTLTRLAP